MQKYKKLIYNTSIIFIGNMGVKVLSFLLLPFYTKYLSPEMYGEFNLVLAVISFLTPLITLELGIALFRIIKEKEEELQKKYVLSSLVITMPYMILFLLLIKTIVNYLKIDYLNNNFLILSMILFFNHINIVLKEKLRCNSKIKLYSAIGVLEAGITLLLNLYLVPKLKFIGMLYSILISTFLISVILILSSKIFKIKYLKEIKFRYLKEMLIFSLPLIPNSIIWWIMGLSDRFFLQHYQGMESVGLYSVANKFSFLVTTIFGIFYKSLQISILEEYKKNDFNIFFTNLFNTISYFLLASSLVIIMFMKIISKHFVSFEYFEIWKYTPLLLICTVLNSYSSVIGVNYLAHKKSKEVLKSSLLATLVNVGLNYLLIPTYGIIGAILATLISYFILFVYRVRDIEKIVKLKLSKQFIVNNILPLVMYSGLVMIKNQTLQIALNIIIILSFILINISYIKLFFQNIRARL